MVAYIVSLISLHCIALQMVHHIWLHLKYEWEICLKFLHIHMISRIASETYFWLSTSFEHLVYIKVYSYSCDLKCMCVYIVKSLKESIIINHPLSPTWITVPMWVSDAQRRFRLLRFYSYQMLVTLLKKCHNWEFWRE